MSLTQLRIPFPCAHVLCVVIGVVTLVRAAWSVYQVTAKSWVHSALKPTYPPIQYFCVILVIGVVPLVFHDVDGGGVVVIIGQLLRYVKYCFGDKALLYKSLYSGDKGVL